MQDGFFQITNEKVIRRLFEEVKQLYLKYYYGLLYSKLDKELKLENYCVEIKTLF